MSRRLSFALGIALALLGVGGSTTAQTQTRHVELHAAGTGGLRTLIDTNGDGITAITAQGFVHGTFGPMIFHNVGEALPPLESNENCPEGTLEVPFLQGFVVVTSLQTGDQLFYEPTAGFICVNVRAGTSTVTTHGHFAGGTGEFAGASGSFEAHFNDTPHVADANGNTFSSSTGTVIGTLHLP
jgi:hypothetical protein